MKLKFFFVVFLVNFIFFPNLYSQENVYIELKIEDEIITNIDINNEKNYLIALNNKLKNLSKDQIYKVSKNSLVREIIKKIELVKFFDLEKSNVLTEGLVKNLYKNLKFNNKNEFNNYLKNYNLNTEKVGKKILIEALWNQLIFDKFNKNIKIDEKKLKFKLKNELNKNKIEEFNLSEIVFQVDSNEKIEEKNKKILNFINNNGFENAANTFSVSDSSKFGGKIGWVNKTQISKIISIENFSIYEKYLSNINKNIQIITLPTNNNDLSMRIQIAKSISNGDINSSTNNEKIIKFENLVIDTEKYLVTLENKKIDLTFKELELLKVLATNPGRVFSRENLLKNIWDYDYYGGTRTVDVHVRRLRRKIEDHKNNFIETIWNVGYKFNENKAGNSNE